MNKIINVVLIAFFAVLTVNNYIGFSLYIPILFILGGKNKRNLILVIPLSIISCYLFKREMFYITLIINLLYIIYLFIFFYLQTFYYPYPPLIKFFDKKDIELVVKIFINLLSAAINCSFIPDKINELLYFHDIFSNNTDAIKFKTNLSLTFAGEGKQLNIVMPWIIEYFSQSKSTHIDLNRYNLEAFLLSSKNEEICPAVSRLREIQKDISVFNGSNPSLFKIYLSNSVSIYTIGEENHSNNVGFDLYRSLNVFCKSQPLMSRTSLIGSSITSRTASSFR